MPDQLNVTNIPSSRVEIIDARTGMISREWYRFFLNLFNLAGAGGNQTSLDDVQLGPPPAEASTSSGGGGSGTVTSVGMSVPTGLSVTGSPVTTSGTFAVTYSAGYAIPTTAKQTEWDTAYAERLQWDGGATNLVAATGRTSLGATTAGGNFFTLPNPSAITFVRINADNTVSTLDAATFRTAIGAGTGSGTVTSVSGTTGNITSTGGATPVIDLASGIVTPNTYGSALLIPVITVDTYGRVTTITTAANPQGTVTSVSVVSANGFAGTSSGGATPALTLSTSITGVLKGNGTALSAATAGTDYSVGTSSLATGILKSTTTTGALSIAVAADFPTLNQNTTGSAATLTTGRTIAITGDLAYTSPSFDGSTNVTAAGTLATVNATVGSFTNASITVNGKGLVTAASSGTAPVTSVTGTSPVASSGGATPAISLTAGYGDTLNPYASKTANYFLAAPDGTAGVPTFRAVVAADIPTLNQNTTGTASNVTGTVAIANGGSGQTTAQLAMNAFAGAVTSGSYLRGNGTNVVMNTIQAADVPTLNQNTSGTASNVTGTVAIANGGTGQTTATAAFNALAPTTTKGDLIVRNGTGNIRVAVGTDTYVLTADAAAASGVKWAAPSGGSSNITSQGLWENNASITSNYTIGTGNNGLSSGPISVSSGVAVTVPTGSSWAIV